MQALVASAVRYLDPASNSWVELITPNTLLYSSRLALEAEITAVSEALRIACQLVDDFDRLVVFTNCQSCLHALRPISTYRALLSRDGIKSIISRDNLLYDYRRAALDAGACGCRGQRARASACALL